MARADEIEVIHFVLLIVVIAIIAIIKMVLAFILKRKKIENDHTERMAFMKYNAHLSSEDKEQVTFPSSNNENKKTIKPKKT